MVLKKKSVAKFASLSALGAGTLALGVQKANATVIYSGVINAKVGFDAGNGFGSSFTSAALGAGSPQFKFSTATHTIGGHSTDKSFKVNFNKVGALSFAAIGTPKVPELFSTGQTWNAKLGNGGSGLVEDRFVGNGQTPFGYNLGGTGPFTDKFFLINFGPGFSEFGWIEASLQVDKTVSRLGIHGPNLTIVSYAYDDSGAMLAAGSLTSPTPEPSTFAMTGLAALALGAAGLRRWRSARKT